MARVIDVVEKICRCSMSNIGELFPHDPVHRGLIIVTGNRHISLRADQFLRLRKEPERIIYVLNGLKQCHQVKWFVDRLLLVSATNDATTDPLPCKAARRC
jgi:hypothetical protein